VNFGISVSPKAKTSRKGGFAGIFQKKNYFLVVSGTFVVSPLILVVVSGFTGVVVSTGATVVVVSSFVSFFSDLLLQATANEAIATMARNFFMIVFLRLLKYFGD
jgi:hypothetical protein